MEEQISMKVVFLHDIDEKGKVCNFKYVLVDKNENVNLVKDDELTIFDGEGIERKVPRKNLSEISPGSTLAALFSGADFLDINDFKRESEKFFEKRGLQVTIHL